MRGWRRSSRARARDEERRAALPTGFPPPNPFAPLSWPPPPADALPLGAPPVAAPVVEAPSAEAAPVEALYVDRAPDAQLHVHEPVPTAAVAAATGETMPVASAPAEAPPVAQPDPPATVAQPAPASPGPAPVASGGETNPEMLRLFEVVTNMCDHVIEYIESDRAERRVMLETLATLGRAITESAAALASRTAAAIHEAETRLIEQPEPRERVIGGSMPAGPEPVIDLRSAPAAAAPAPVAAAVAHSRHEAVSPVASVAPAVSPAPTPAPTATTSTVMTTEIAVEVRGRFGDRWVDGFEICEVMETPEGHRYRLRRHRDGVVLPELFDATSIRHVETFDQLATTNGTHVPRENGHSDGRDAGVNDATGYAAPAITGSPAQWSRS
jgi:hypothetical protein